MEFVDGPPLKTLLDKHERFALADTVRVMQDLLAGLQFSHERGVVHRDIKPANVMLTSTGQAKIADFGIARIESSSMTQAGTVLGTPAYMSPEQFMGQVVDARTDIYSSGVLLYQLLTGERPFDGGMSAIMHKALNTEPPAPSQLSVTAPAIVRCRGAARDGKAAGGPFPVRQRLRRGDTSGPGEPGRTGRHRGRSDDHDRRAAAGTCSATPDRRRGIAAIRRSDHHACQTLQQTRHRRSSRLAWRCRRRYLWFLSRPPVPPHPVTVTPIAPPPPSPPITPTVPAVGPTSPNGPLAPPIGGDNRTSAEGTTPSQPTKPPVAPPEQPPSADVLRRQIAQWASSQNCAVLGGNMDDAGRVTLNGLAGHGFIDDLRRGLTSLVPAGQTDWRVAGVSRVFCPALTALHAITPAFGASEATRLRLQMEDKTRLHDGEPCSGRLVMPDFTSWLRVDYVAHDGSVQHLYPQLADPKNAIAADPRRTFAPGEPLNLGHSSWLIGPPYAHRHDHRRGSVRAAVRGRRPSNAETAEVYLRDLQTAIDALRQRGVRLAGAVVTVEALP